MSNTSKKSPVSRSGRFSGGPAADVAQFTESISFDWRLWKHDIQGSIAHATMLAQIGVLKKNELDAIVKGLTQIAKEIAAGKFTWKAELEDVHMNIESELTKRVPAGAKLHTARSRNDQVALDVRLWLRDEITALLGESEKLPMTPALRGATFAACDVDDAASLAAALQGADLVVHAAGPFQRQSSCAVLEAAIAARVPYVDVCDDTEYAQRAKALHSRAEAAGVRALVCAGMFPGVSNLMAAQIVRTNAAADGGEALAPKRVAYSYFTAGSGGAGTTILATSILLCGEDVTAYKDGAAVVVPPVTGRRVVDFGPVRGPLDARAAGRNAGR